MSLFQLQKKGSVPNTSVLFAHRCGKLDVDKVDVPDARMTIERWLNNGHVLQGSLMLRSMKMIFSYPRSKTRPVQSVKSQSARAAAFMISADIQLEPFLEYRPPR